MKSISKTIAIFLIVTTTISCSIFGSLTSVTTIQGNESFVLGNNNHGRFKVILENTSKETIKVLHAPLAGGTHSTEMVKPNETVTVKVDPDTVLRIQNPSNQKIDVKLKVTGDTGLQMGFQK